jgi:DNA adenine methylase
MDTSKTVHSDFLFKKLLPNNSHANKLTPPLKWAGGKRWLVPHLEKIYNPHRHRRLVELFVGGLAVALGLMPERALLNDINPHLINFYLWLKKGLFTRLEMKYDRELYYTYRDRFNQLIVKGRGNTQEAAELFYYLNRTCYNGLCRFNRKGEFNVPFGKYKTVVYTQDFTKYTEILRNWEFTCLDFRQVNILPGDFVYADPPYDVEFTEYNPDGFSWEDQVALAKMLTNHAGPVVLSNQATLRIVELYNRLGYELHFLPAPRRISCNGNRDRVLEVLATRNL